jgi:hypothetical protein
MSKERQSKWRRTLKGRFVFTARKAAERRIPFKLTLEGFSDLVKDPCRYCGAALSATGSGLDRKDSYLGYTLDNCVPCCTVCNRIRGKDSISYSEMFEVIKLLRQLRSVTA